MKYAITLVLLCGVASASPPLKVENLQASSTITQAGNRVYSIAGTGLTSTAATVSIIPCSTNQVLVWNGSAWACSASVGITGAGTTNDLVIYTNGPAGIIGNYAGTGSVADKALTAFSAAGVGTFQYFYDSPGTGLAVGATGNVVKLADTAVTPGTYALPGSLTIDQQGRVTNAVAFAGSSPSACTAGSLTSQPTLGAAGALTNNCTTLTSAANSSGGGSSTTYLNGAGGWTTPPGTGVTGTGTTNTTVKYTNGAGGVIGNAWPTDDATTWGVASRFTITEANGNFRSFGTGTIDGAATLSSTATVATSLAVGTSSTAATIAEIRGSYDKTVANTGQLRIAESTSYRLSIGFDEAGGTAGVIDESFADPTSEIDLRWANVNKAQFFGNGNLTLVGGLALTFMHASTDASVGTTLAVTGLTTLTGGFNSGAESIVTAGAIGDRSTNGLHFAFSSNVGAISATQPGTANRALTIDGSTLSLNTLSGGAVTIGGALTANSTAHIVGAATLDSTLGVTGSTSLTAQAGTTTIVAGASTATSIGNQDVALRIRNTNATTNNWGALVFDTSASAAASIEAKYVDVTNHYADLNFATRAADGYLARMVISSAGITSMLGQGLGVGGLYEGQIQDSGDVLQSGLLRKNVSTFTDELGNTGDLSQAAVKDAGWGFNSSGNTIAYAVPALSTMHAPHAFASADNSTWIAASPGAGIVGQITCTSGGTACSAGGSDYRQVQSKSLIGGHGISDLRSATITFSVWLRMASGTATPQIGLGRYNDDSQTYTSCGTVTATAWTRCTTTKTFNSTSLTDNSELRRYIQPLSTTAMYISDAQTEIGSVPTPYQPNDSLSSIGAYGSINAAGGTSFPNYSAGAGGAINGDVVKGAYVYALGVGNSEQDPNGGIAPDGTVFGKGFYTAAGNAVIGGALNGYTQLTKLADQDVTNSTTLTDDNTLQFSVTAGKIYAIDAFIIVGGSDATGDYKSAWTVAAGTMDCSGTEESLTTADAIQTATVIATAAASTNSTAIGTRADASLPIGTRWTLACKVSNTTTLKYQFAENSAVSAKVARTMAGSFVKYKQLN